ncbi:hypothetical protein [Candidatus Uabimicrobium amorphum]|uniref:Uncharacterized protein n=1 Tax=Uabimicrobium amorphum TaxID=2596890 RepID=A0A5S9ILI6_UABAM|nr:hypothetical protein [Candidatus Uabimicrobium amorphum]BBM84108.1 hypothetical protein UABAM_02464 [Candidatus Uabimicrobium amorphum]
MENNTLSTKNIYMILLPLVFVTVHEICFFAFLWVKLGFTKAIRINSSLLKWLQYLKTADLDYYLACWLVPILLTILVTYTLVFLLQRSTAKI